LGLAESQTWDDLVAAWRKSSARPADIKGWLNETHGVRVSLTKIRQASEDVAMRAALGEDIEFPSDLADLALTIRAASRRY